MLRILVADRNSTLRIGLTSVLRKNVNNVNVDEVTDHHSLLSTISSGYDLVVIEPLLNECAYENLIRDLFHEAPRCNVLVYTTLDERTFGIRALKLGAKGYLRKNSPVEELLTAVERVSQGKIYISAVLAEELALRLGSQGVEHPHQLLSEREMQTFSMLVCGMTIGEISAVLNLSVKTVSTNKARVFAKLQVRTLSEMIQYAVGQNLIEECKAKFSSLSLAAEAYA